jgi:hypothetical protein
LLDGVASRPDKDTAELEELAREIEARGTGVYAISATEWADPQESLRQADRREFVSDESLGERISDTGYEGPLREAHLRTSRKNL